MKKMTKLFALALLAGAMVSCSTEDTASSTPNGKVAVPQPACPGNQQSYPLPDQSNPLPHHR